MPNLKNLIGQTPSLKAQIDKALAKHKRLCYIIQSEEVGLVAMIPVGFWGVGSIITEHHVGDYVKKGEEIGHFAYGRSSILLIFEPGAIKFSIPVGVGARPGQNTDSG